ncbi:hypothetical protein GNF80_09955 [Clostridium perfringens]|nr:hypothetical protein [Clostridium perfringens]
MKKIRTLSEETRIRMSESKKKLYAKNGHHCTGTIRPQEIKEKISNTLKEYYKTHKHHCDGKKQSEDIVRKRVESCKEKYKKFGHWTQVNPILGAEHHGAKKTKLELVGEQPLYFDTRKDCAAYLSEKYDRPLKTIQNWIDNGIPKYMKDDIVDIKVGVQM